MMVGKFRMLISIARRPISIASDPLRDDREPASLRPQLTGSGHVTPWMSREPVNTAAKSSCPARLTTNHAADWELLNKSLLVIPAKAGIHLASKI
jgi:hypothetical protein